MTILKGQIALESAQDKKPNKAKVATLAPTLTVAAQKYPQLPETWSAVSALVSYRTSSGASDDAILPDCDVDKPKSFFYPANLGFPEYTHGGNEGYFFENCKLYMDRLPGHRMVLDTKPNPNSALPEFRKSVHGLIGVLAFARNVVIVWRGNLSDTNIISITTRDCRYEFQVNSVPNQQSQQFLLAALNSPQAGSAVLNIQATN